MTSALEPHNARKYCEFHEKNGHTTAECRELRKNLHELVDKGQIDCLLKGGPRFLRKEHKPIQSEPREEEFSTKIVATIAGGFMGVIAFTVRGHDLAVQRHGLLIAWTVFISRGRIKIHHLRILTLGLDLVAILNALNIRLEIALLAESVRSKGHQEFLKEFYTFLMSPLVALMLGLGRPLSFRCSPSLCFGMGFFQLAL
ncbi:hypothetical protein Cgig2_002642 [Carnegiea gigantea]|uniref:Reverse transcriptase domain-containing protein n=1 Tax=Carnegiea gigantea TaxID=171969 RepID=A0A9Q1GGS0_9CARY|nr:hypothetical protein Cgig2_002642 [Carnegiea gigantea]